VLLTILKIRNPNQRGRAKDRVIAKCLVAVNEKEINPKVLLKIIKANRAIKIKMLSLEFFSSTENSRVIALKISLVIWLKGDTLTQKEGASKTVNIISLIQFKDKLNEEEGSKIEKRLFIIFRCGKLGQVL
jgi:hypothetical protein